MQPRNEYIDGSVIHHPISKVIYHIKAPTLTTKEIAIRLDGDCSKIEKFHVTGLIRDYPDTTIMYASDLNVLSLESIHTLPPTFSDALPPLVALVNKSQLCAVTKVQYNVDNNAARFQFEQLTAEIPLEIRNTTLRRECQVLAGAIQVQTGEHFIYDAKKHPNEMWLHTLYSQFMEYNGDKLSYQLSLTTDLCHIRAHFVSTMLSQYKVDSVKIFKLWPPLDWKKMNSASSWTWHSSVMIIDNANQKWIWDPWVKDNKHLLTLQQWLNYPNQPKPYRCVITNRGVLSDYIKGRFVHIDGLDHTSFAHRRDIFQAMYASAIPNPPEKPIHINVLMLHGVFRNKTKLDKPKQSSAECVDLALTKKNLGK